VRTLAQALRPRASAPISYVGSRLGGTGIGLRGGGGNSPMDAMGANGTLFAMVSTAASDFAAVKWHLYRRAPSGKDEDRVEILSHAALDVWNKPNPHMTGQAFREISGQHVELVGETEWVVGRSTTFTGFTAPLELWPIRPDRMTPVPSAADFLAGWVYASPDGEKVPLEVDDVIQIKLPNPADVYRGLGPVQAVLMDIDAVKYSATWNRNFFLNDASPGGIIEVDETLSDDDFREMTQRWREQHQGVHNAHRVAVLERGKWVERSFNQRDMQFVELRNVSREVIREALSFPKPMLGAVDDVNRANADAAEVVWGRWFLNRRLRRWRDAVNFRLLPMFFGKGQPVDLEFDYDNPVPSLPEDEQASLASKTTAAVALIAAGFDPDEVCDFVGIPRIKFVGPPKAPAPTPGPTPPSPAPAAHAHTHRLTLGGPRNSEPDPRPGQMKTVQGDWQKVLDQVVDQWADITKAQRAEIRKQVKQAVDDGKLADLGNITVTTSKAVTILTAAMVKLGKTAAGRVAEEAKQQDIDLDPVDPDEDDLADYATGVSDLLGQGLAGSAGRKALQVVGPDSSGKDVADAVDDHLDSLSDRYLTDNLGGALTSAQNRGRIATMKAGPEAAYYANEMNDANTCEPCEEIDGKWLGNSVDEVEQSYPNGGYVDCLGGIRCRGTITAIYRGGSASKWFESEDAPEGD
jgi:HK97 family phage portal protein